MANNEAERRMRGPVLGRKAYYGSGSEWSAELTAMMFSLFQTLTLWQINPKLWLQEFFRYCKEGRVNETPKLLPWNVSPEARQAWLFQQPEGNSS